MSTQEVSSVVLSATPGNHVGSINTVERPLADYPPSVWGDYFCKYTDDHLLIEHDMAYERRFYELKDEVSKMIIVDGDKPLEVLVIIDQVQRLGIEYLFESEIGKALGQIHKIYFECDGVAIDNDLHMVALLFRMLRQEGYRISSDIFSKFLDEMGSFTQSLVNNVHGLLSLYEASHMKIRGENILEDARAFTSTHLEASLENCLTITPGLKAQVMHGLKQPIHKGIPRVEARWYLQIYQEDPSCNDKLVALAKLDFNLAQKQHQMELGEISRWWKEANFKSKLPFARDRVVECYFWAASTYFEPQYSFGRTFLSKVLALISLIDDAYDAYGTLDELGLFTNAVQRWEKQVDDKMPDYLQVLYMALFGLYDKYGRIFFEQGKPYFLDYAKEGMKSLIIKGYMEEAKWLQQPRMPSFEEYMSIALVTAAYGMLATTAFVGMGDVATKDVLEWSSSGSKIIKASEIVLRLGDDITTHKFEQKREHIPSAVECYMKQHHVTEEDAKEELSKQLSNAWKDINEECLQPTIYPKCILMRVVNLARVVEFMYKGEDHYTNSHIAFKDVIRSLYVDQIPI